MHTKKLSFLIKFSQYLSKKKVNGNIKGKDDCLESKHCFIGSNVEYLFFPSKKCQDLQLSRRIYSGEATQLSCFAGRDEL
jgi:hypothetical protein